MDTEQEAVDNEFFSWDGLWVSLLLQQVEEGRIQWVEAISLVTTAFASF
jgi:hypothetical protein